MDSIILPMSIFSTSDLTPSRRNVNPTLIQKLIQIARQRSWRRDSLEAAGAESGAFDSAGVRFLCRAVMRKITRARPGIISFLPRGFLLFQKADTGKPRSGNP